MEDHNRQRKKNGYSSLAAVSVIMIDSDNVAKPTCPWIRAVPVTVAAVTVTVPASDCGADEPGHCDRSSELPVASTSDY